MKLIYQCAQCGARNELEFNETGLLSRTRFDRESVLNYAYNGTTILGRYVNKATLHACDEHTTGTAHLIGARDE